MDDVDVVTPLSATFSGLGTAPGDGDPIATPASGPRCTFSSHPVTGVTRDGNSHECTHDSNGYGWRAAAAAAAWKGEGDE